MIIREVTTKTCLGASKLCDYVINPYVGCQHACKYCYAVFMKRFQNICEPWGSFVHIKSNSAEVLERELARKPGGHVWISSVTDAYMPIERKVKLTRKILETIVVSPHKEKFSFELLTKSSLVERDFDLLQRLNCRLGCSLNTLNHNAARLIEPLASKPEARITTLLKAKEHDIPVYGFISPVIPDITDLAKLFAALQFTEYVWVELLNTTKSVLSRLLPVLKKDFPQAARSLLDAMADPERYYNNRVGEVKELSDKYHLKVEEVVRHQ